MTPDPAVEQTGAKIRAGHPRLRWGSTMRLLVGMTVALSRCAAMGVVGLRTQVTGHVGAQHARGDVRERIG